MNDHKHWSGNEDCLHFHTGKKFIQIQVALKIEKKKRWVFLRKRFCFQSHKWCQLKTLLLYPALASHLFTKRLV